MEYFTHSYYKKFKEMKKAGDLEKFKTQDHETEFEGLLPEMLKGVGE